MASASTEVPGAPVIVVMGVSGSGKSTVAQMLAKALQLDFAEGDAFHPPGNIAKMRSGTALSDIDRQGWLSALATHMATQRLHSKGLVLSCSALKRSYRDVLRAAVPDLQLLYLAGDNALIAQRLAARSNHYMPGSLLQSQFADLQEPQADERAHRFPITQTPQHIVGAFCLALRTRESA